MPAALMSGGITASFLKLNSDARTMGTGNSFAAISNGVNSIILNPAGLSNIQNKEIAMNYSNLYADMRYGFIGWGMPIDQLDAAFALGAQYLNSGEMEQRDINRKNTGSYTNKDMTINLGYGRNFPEMNLNLGLNVKYITSKIEEESANTLAMDIGGIYKTKQGINLGLTVQNIGSGLKYIDKKDPLPLTISAGAGYQMKAGPLLALGIKNSVYEKKTTISLGMEYSILSAFNLRTGYLTGKDLSSVSGGFGIAITKD
ncbi:MAG: PorV/PorQ family protein [Elusimicrobia bacterium]|nr:PorV/PorQ family protein [Elusimicrobiota bacterium]